MEMQEAADITHFGVTGDPRKRLVQRIAALSGASAEYLGFPSCAYQVGKYKINKDGSVEGRLSKAILRGLKRSGFEPQQ